MKSGGKISIQPEKRHQGYGKDVITCQVCVFLFFCVLSGPGCSPSPTRQLVCIIQGLMAGSLRGDSRRAGARAGFWVRADHKCKLVRN